MDKAPARNCFEEAGIVIVGSCVHHDVGGVKKARECTRQSDGGNGGKTDRILVFVRRRHPFDDLNDNCQHAAFTIEKGCTGLTKRLNASGST